MKGRIQKLCLASTQRRALRVERTFMTPEYESTSRKDAMTPFSTSSAIVGPNSRNLIPLTRDWTTCDLRV